MTEIEAEFWPLFEEVPRYTNTLPQPSEDIKKLDYPITFREMQAVLRHMKQSACGSDELTREDLKAANGTDLVGLLNIAFGLVCCIPFILRHNRTVLIPKKGDFSKVHNWSPITISSILTRLLHKILASRLSENIKLHHAQRGFTPCDDVITSYTILDTIIREHRWETTLCVVHRSFQSFQQAPSNSDRACTDLQRNRSPHSKVYYVHLLGRGHDHAK